MKRRNFLKAALLTPFAGIASSAKGKDVLTPKAKECMKNPYHVWGQSLDLLPEQNDILKDLPSVEAGEMSHISLEKDGRHMWLRYVVRGNK